MKLPEAGLTRLPVFLLGKGPDRKFHQDQALVFSEDIDPARQGDSFLLCLNDGAHFHPPVFVTLLEVI